MLRGIRCFWPVCLLLAAGIAVAQPPVIVTTLPRPADNSSAGDVPPTNSIQTIPPTAVLLQPPATLQPQSVVEESLNRERIRSVLADSPAEVGLLFPTVYQHLNANVNVGSLYSTMVQVPSVPMHVTGSPMFDLRVRLLNLGELGVAYRLLASEGHGASAGLDPAGIAALHSRLDVQVIDLNYYMAHDVGNWSSLLAQLDHTHGYLPRWGMNLDAGVRLASVFFDSRAVGPTIDRHISNYIFGAGPRFGMTLTRLLGDSVFALYGRLDTAAVFGGVQQRFSELASPGGVPTAFGYTAQRSSQGVPTLTAHVGISTANPLARFGQWQVGYQFEQWWMLGDVGASTASLLVQGLFVRWTVNY